MQTERKISKGGTGKAQFLARFQKDEAGSFTIFGLFIFLMIIMVAGLAVDMMRYEHERVGVQNTLDTAIVAATRLNQEADTNEEIEALVKDYFRTAGYDPDIVDVVPNIEGAAGGGEETLRTVEARVNFSMNTAFMNMLGIDELDGVVGGGAREGQQIIEVALVLDISGSMGWGTKLDNMQEAAKQFVSIVLDNNGPERVMISIIPYNMQVQMSEDLQNRLDIANTMVIIDPEPTHPGAISQYITHNSAARCARFLDADYDSRRLAASGDLEPSGKFATGNWSYNRPGNNADSNAYWCGSGYPEMMLFQNDEQKLHDHIDSLSARGMTAIDYGMKWATGILDPSFRPIVQGMLADSNTARANAQQAAADNGTSYVPPSQAWIVPDNVAGHPVDLGTPNVFKYIVLMTDGANTQHLDLKNEFKSGPTRIWYSQEVADLSGNDFWDGFMVEMPENSASQRWYIPGNPNDTGDDQYRSEAWFAGLDDTVVEQWGYHQLYERFSVNDAANYFFRTDSAARTAHRNALEDTGGYGTADNNLERICDQATESEWMTVYAVAFEAPEGGQQALQRCIGDSQGRYFAVQGEQLIAAFNEIAAEITQLRLTQ